jgi:hypothetical protein
MCYLKQWGRARKRIGELIRLGSPKHQAIEGPEPKRLLVSCQDVCDQLRIVERILTGSGACFTTHIVDRDSLSGHGPMTYPIRRSLFVVCPHAYYLHGLNVVEHLIDKTVLNI